MSTADEATAVPISVGDLRARIHVPANAAEATVAVVLVDGSGDGTLEDWGEWPTRYAGCGAVVLSHDKPGCGGSPGDWMTQSLTDRAQESLAAVHVLRAHPSVDRRPVGLVGVSQGGWVALLAASLAPSSVDSW